MGGEQQPAMLDAEKTPGTSLGLYALGICESLIVNIVHQKRKKYINSYNSPMIEANSSGAELPKAMKVAPATSD